MTIVRRNSPTGERLSLRQAMNRLKTEVSKARQARIRPTSGLNAGATEPGETPAEQNGKQS